MMKNSSNVCVNTNIVFFMDDIQKQVNAIKEATEQAAKGKESALKFLQDAGIVPQWESMTYCQPELLKKCVVKTWLTFYSGWHRLCDGEFYFFANDVDSRIMMQHEVTHWFYENENDRLNHFL